MAISPSNLPNPVLRYLEDLELALKQKSGVTPEDALSDAREHLCRHYKALHEDRPDCSEQVSLRRLEEAFGKPSDMAAQYEDAAKKIFLRLPGYAPGWRTCCTRCGRSAPAAKVGITRIGAASRPKYVGGWCHNCGWFRWIHLIKDLDKVTLTSELGVSTTAESFRKTTHRPWVVVATILIIVIGGLAVMGQLGALAVRAADPIFQNLRDDWKLMRSDAIPDQQTAAIAERFDVQIDSLSNSHIADREGGVLQVNVVHCPTEEDAAELYTAFAKMHENPRDCILNDSTVYELIPRAANSARLYAEARNQLGMVPQKRTYTIQFDAAPISAGDPISWNKLFNLFLQGAHAEGAIQELSQRFTFSDNGVEGHVWAEVVLEDAWHQIDPTTGSECGSDYIPIVATEDGKIPFVYASHVRIEVME